MILLLRLKFLQVTLSEKISSLEKILKRCELCPRNCHADRTAGETGFCMIKNQPFISSWGPHFGEESPLVGRFGSGTIFFTGCSLGCIFCQNYSISHQNQGEEISFEKLASIMLQLQQAGCHNINLVTPTHQSPMILNALETAKTKGLSIPIVYNCGGYESLQVIKLLDGIVDIYMPDFKYADSKMALKYSDAPDYPEIVQTAITEMHRQAGDLVIDKNGIAKKGLLVRHLVLPNSIADTEKIVQFIAGISKDTYINIMDQYHPCHEALYFPELNRKVTDIEYKDAINLALKAGLRRIDRVTV